MNTKKWTQIAISAFLLFHLIVIACWSAPIQSPLLEAFRSLVRPYMLWSGLFQSWDMFAPLPKSENDYLQAVVITRDGHLHTWKFPRMEQLGLLKRYSKERYRKFTENIQDYKYAAVWPDIAVHLVRRFNSPTNPPDIVMLIRYWSVINPSSDKSSAAAPEQAHIFFEYRVKREDLR